MRFRQDVRSREINEDSCKERQIDGDVVIIECDRGADRGSTDSSSRINSKKKNRPLGPIAALD